MSVRLVLGFSEKSEMACFEASGSDLTKLKNYFIQYKGSTETSILVF